MSEATPLRDRYADAVRARRAELRADRVLLLGGHRAELRGCLAAARLTASAELAATLAGLEREVRHHADRAGRVGRAALPGLVDAAVGGLLDQVVDRWVATVLPGIRRVAAVRCHDLTVAGPVAEVLLRRPAVTLPAPDPPPGAVRALLAGATEGTWRVALLPAAVLPAVGLPAVAGRSALPLAVGVGLALLAAAVQARRAAADRMRLRRWATEAVSVLRSTLETELARRLLEVERLAAAGLDDAVARRRGEVEAALRALAADPPAVATAGR
jgi:hypothetical protein